MERAAAVAAEHETAAAGAAAVSLPMQQARALVKARYVEGSGKSCPTSRVETILINSAG